MENSLSNRLHLGAAYYPEHWPEERWPEDIRLMREAGFTVVRLAEFAWSALEPADGEFDFDWLERAISALAAAGIVSVLGTPTAAPPAWLVQQQPDIVAVSENGRRLPFGARCHYCVNSPEFHDAVRRLVGAVAARFGANPHVIGWQIDNEYCRVCYCDRCRRLFQEHLADKFGSLEALNTHWTTRYWSQTYSAWEQIPLPHNAYPDPIEPHNPGLRLEFNHFVTESYRRFQRLQIDALRPCLRPGVWITHNFMRWYDGYDHYSLAQDLDLASWDWYESTGHNDYLSSGAAHDLTRGFKRRNFWVMETQPGTVNWAPVNAALNKGEIRAMAWHSVGHGADAVLYWQWRSALGGQEQYHGTVVDQSGQPRPLYEEVRQLGRELATAAPLLGGSTPSNTVALLNCYDSRWALQFQRHHRDFDYVAHFSSYYRPLAARNVGVDIISADEGLDGYRLVIAPSLHVLNETRAVQLRRFVEGGGRLVLTIRTGMKDVYNAMLPARQPGPLADLAGVEVEDYYALLDPIAVAGPLLNGTARVWAERLKVRADGATEVVARYGAANGWLDGHPAVTTHAFGRGLVYFVAAWLDDAAQQAFLDNVIGAAGVQPMMAAPDGVEVCRRVRDGREIFILINHHQDEQQVMLAWPALEHLTGKAAANSLRLEPYGVAILTRLA
jgi:beta-galactosidase